MPGNVKSFDRLDYTFKLLVVISLILAATVLAKDIVIPMSFAALLSIVILPLVKILEQRKIPTWFSITLVLLLVIVGMSLLVWLMVNQIVSLVNDLPDLQNRFTHFINDISLLAQDTLNISSTDQTNIVTDAMKAISTYLGNVLLTTTNTISTLIQIPIYIFLFLIYRDKFRKFFISLMPGSETVAWKKDVERVIQGYASGMVLVTLIIATLNCIGLLIVGIDHAIFFGILSGVLTIIPYIGIFIGAAFPVIMALITKDSIWYTVGVVLVFTVVQFLEGNFITPRITGSKVSINALAAIIALLIGGKILGIAGMILAIPFIGVMKVLLSHSNHLKPFVILLEDKETTTTEPGVEEINQNSTEDK